MATFLLALLPLAAAASPAVVEARTAPSVRMEPRIDDGVPGDTGGGALAYRLQVLQEEVSQLRGLVEEQAHLIERLTNENRERYLDLDRRVALLSGGASSGVADVPQPAAADPGQAASASEQAAYEAAFGLTRERRYDDAIAAFNAFLVDYPSGGYTANAFYWLGELYLAVPEPQLELARQSFAQVLNLYPDHPKIADTLYKLGIVYDRLGSVDRAREYLQRTINEHEGSAAARLATSYLAELR